MFNKWNIALDVRVMCQMYVWFIVFVVVVLGMLI